MTLPLFFLFSSIPKELLTHQFPKQLGMKFLKRGKIMKLVCNQSDRTPINSDSRVDPGVHWGYT